MGPQMLFQPNGNQDVTLTPVIVGNNGPGATARFDLYILGAGGTAAPVPRVAGGFQIPGQPSGTVLALRLDTLAAFNGATAGDVSVTASQSSGPLTNASPTAGKPANWLCTVTQEGVIDSE